MRHLIKRSYQSIIDRKCIDENTTTLDFINKLEEELKEVKEAYQKGIFVKWKKDPFYGEVLDLINTGINLLTHHEIDFIEGYENCVVKQEKRARGDNDLF